MRGNLIGAEELQSRLRELGTAFRPIGRKWADSTATEASRSAPRRTGKMANSFRVTQATDRKATVGAIFYAKFLNVGAKPHAIKAKRSPALIFSIGGNTIFARAVKHRGMRGTRFVDKAAQAALQKHATAQALIDAWNRGA